MISSTQDTVTHRPTASAASVVFVVPGGSINPRSGTGQRTSIFFEGLGKLGPVAVLVLADKGFENDGSLFPGAQKVRGLTSAAMSRPPRNTAIRVLHAIGRFLSPGRTYAPQPGLDREILTLFADLDGRTSRRDGPLRPRILATRYARSFALTGLRTQAADGLFCCVDIDDRDDQKIDHQIRTRIGNVLGGLFALIWKPRFLNHFQTTLSRASIVLLAKDADCLPGLSARQVTVPNVPYHGPDATRIIPASDTAETLLFVGIASHRPNLSGVTWFLRSCWPAIRAARPSANIRIVGLGDWSALPADLVAQPGVVVVGIVDDLAPEYAHARAAICPIREGAGSQIKVIEACAYGRPVVSTEFASGGFGPEIERTLSVAADASQFAQACIDLLADPARAAEQGAALRALQQATHSREAVQNLIVTTLTDLIASSRMSQKVPS